MSIYSDNNLNVEVVSFTLQDEPASILVYIKISDKYFYSKITYHSIPCWQDVWNKCLNHDVKKLILGALVAWDSMRFLALGGEELILCEGLVVDEETQQLWRYCFLNQFGEWRYRNDFQYSNKLFPRVIVKDSSDLDLKRYITYNLNYNENSHNHSQKEAKHIITNGGGKDTLVGMSLMNDLNINYDVYEGYLPVGGSWQLQEFLLKILRDSLVHEKTQVISVTVEDNFFNTDDSEILKLGVLAKYYKTDFAVGHTANYPGYYPIIMYHGYTHVWFNIEASADRTMVNWHDEPINHQWCKSADYQEKSTKLYQKIAGHNIFKGFFSTIRGLHDTHIYSIAVEDEELIKKTHSCNYGKPWCFRCPKCCFSYLMLTSFKGENFAMEVLGSNKSLFDMPENLRHFEDLLDPNLVAWECVPSHEECLLALVKCAQQNINNDIVLRFAKDAYSKINSLEALYSVVEWYNIPMMLRDVTLRRILKSGASCNNYQEVYEDNYNNQYKVKV